MFLLEAQGTQVSMRDVSLDVLKPSNPTKRGKVSEFTRASRNRVMNLLTRLAPMEHQPKFMTLTYSGVPDHERAKRDFRTFVKRLLRKCPEMSAVWRVELQKRGAAHFHLILFDMPYVLQSELRKNWMDCTGEDRSGVHIQRIRSAREVMSYVSKYIAKAEAAVEKDTLLVNASYLTAEVKWQGRHWGVVNAKNLPFAPHFCAIVRDEDVSRYFRYYVQRASKGKGGRNVLKQVLYTDEAQGIFAFTTALDNTAWAQESVEPDYHHPPSRAERKRIAAAFTGKSTAKFRKANLRAMNAVKGREACILPLDSKTRGQLKNSELHECSTRANSDMPLRRVENPFLTELITKL